MAEPRSLETPQLPHTPLTPAYSDYSFCLGSDIDPWLFEAVFHGETFKCWLREDSSWYLRIIGGPGSGKTSLAALVVEACSLRKPTTGHQEAVASIFLKHETTFTKSSLTASLLSILYQLRQTSDLPTEKLPWLGDLPSQSNDEDHQINQLVSALKSCIDQFNTVFLIVDGIDQHGWFPRDRFEDIVQHLQHQCQHLKVLLTSRTIVRSEEECDELKCDLCAENSSNVDNLPRLRVHWRCSNKEHPHELDETGQKSDPELFDICQDCFFKSQMCSICVGDLQQPYKRRIISLDEEMSHSALTRYVGWSLENEHGDINLSHDWKEDLPLSSRFGRETTANITSKRGNAVREELIEHAGENIAMCRLRLDHYCGSWVTVDSLIKPSYTSLPQEICDFFISIIKEIENQSKEMAYIGLHSIAFVTFLHSDEQRILASDLIEKLEQNTARTKVADHFQYTEDKILRASRGLLSQKWEWDGYVSQSLIFPYHNSLKVFVADRMSSTINEAWKNLQHDL